MKANCTGHILCRTCLLKHATEGKIEAKRQQGRRNNRLQDNLKENRRYWNLKQVALDHSLEYMLWKRLPCCKTDNTMNEGIQE
jgi:hypothetical protein